MKKKITRYGIDYYHCPDCEAQPGYDAYNLKKDMTRDKYRPDNVGTYCKKHRKIRKAKYHSEQKNKRCKLGYTVSNVRKYHFKHQEKKVFDGPTCVEVRTYGVCKNWGKVGYERKAVCDG